MFIYLLKFHKQETQYNQQGLYTYDSLKQQLYTVFNRDIFTPNSSML